MIYSTLEPYDVGLIEEISEPAWMPEAREKLRAMKFSEEQIERLLDFNVPVTLYYLPIPLEQVRGLLDAAFQDNPYASSILSDHSVLAWDSNRPESDFLSSNLTSSDPGPPRQGGITFTRRP